MANASHLKWYYTGGGANSTLSSSIGGAISSVALALQTVTGTPPSGVTINGGLGNTPGAGTLTYTASTKTLFWQGFGASVGTGVVVDTDGQYFIQSAAAGSGGLSVTVVASTLPGSNGTYPLTVSNATEKMFLNVSKDDSNTGKSFYHCFALKNTSADKIIDIKVFMSENTPGADTITMYLDPLAASNGATGPTAVADENTAPAGSTFVNPTSSTHADVLSVGTLLTTEVRFVWFHELIPANVSTATDPNTWKVGISARM